MGLGSSSPTAIGGGITTLELKGNDGAEPDRSGGIRFTRQDSTFAGSIYHSDGSFIMDGGAFPILLRQNSSERARFDSGGNFMIDTTSSFSGARFSLFKDAGDVMAIRNATVSYVAIRFQSNLAANVGAISCNATNTSYGTSSDYRLKENITPIQGAADIVKAMQPATYTFKSDGSWQDGFLAHELERLIPGAVIGEKDKMKDEEYDIEPAEEAVVDADGKEIKPAKKAKKGIRSVPDMQMVDYSKLTPILTAALQEALAKIDDLTARIDVLEAKK